MHTPAQPWRSPRLCERPFSRGIFLLAKPLRAQRHAYSQRSLGVLRAFARASFLAGYFFAKPQRALRHALPCAALAISATLREPHFSRDIFLAKPLRALRHAHPCAALAFSTTPRPYSTASMIQSSMLRWSSEKLMATLYLWRLSSAKALR